MKMFLINTEIVAERTPTIFTPTSENMFDNKYCDGGTVGSDVLLSNLNTFATIRCRVLPNIKYMINNIGNCTNIYAARMSYADSDNKLIEYIPAGTNYSKYFTVPDNSDICYVYLSTGWSQPVPQDKELETSSIVAVPE